MFKNLIQLSYGFSCLAQLVQVHRYYRNSSSAQRVGTHPETVTKEIDHREFIILVPTNDIEKMGATASQRHLDIGCP